MSRGSPGQFPLAHSPLPYTAPRSTQLSTLCGIVKWVPAKGRWCSVAGKVIAGLAESNGSLPPGGWLIVTCGLTACTLGSAPDPTLGNEYGKPLPFFTYPAGLGLELGVGLVGLGSVGLGLGLKLGLGLWFGLGGKCVEGNFWHCLLNKLRRRKNTWKNGRRMEVVIVLVVVISGSSGNRSTSSKFTVIFSSYILVR